MRGLFPRAPRRELREVRARFLAEETTFEQVLADLAWRDDRLARAARTGEAIVLWFEHDLYDQLQLVEIFDFLDGERVGWERVTIVCGDEYLGLSTPDRLRDRFPQRVAVPRDAVHLARRAWDSFRAPDPTALVFLVAMGDRRFELLPFLAWALRRHLEQFPSTRNGLSRSEQQALEAIAAGAATVRDAFVASQRREDPIFLGDTVFAGYLEELSQGPVPLVELRPDADVMDAVVALTDTGAAVLRDDADRVRVNGIDRWFGGVHLKGREAAWRRDGTTLRSAAL